MAEERPRFLPVLRDPTPTTGDFIQFREENGEPGAVVRNQMIEVVCIGCNRSSLAPVDAVPNDAPIGGPVGRPHVRAICPRCQANPGRMRRLSRELREFKERQEAVGRKFRVTIHNITTDRRESHVVERPRAEEAQAWGRQYAQDNGFYVPGTRVHIATEFADES